MLVGLCAEQLLLKVMKEYTMSAYTRLPVFVADGRAGAPSCGDEDVDLCTIVW